MFKQRRARCEAWCEERAGAASPEASVRAKGCVFICPINREKQRGDVRRNGAGADLLVVRPRGFANMTERLRVVRLALVTWRRQPTCRRLADATANIKSEIARADRCDDLILCFLSIHIRDNGVGIPKDLNWRDTKSLGLRMVFSLVEQMKGTLGLDRSNGTEFSMVLEEWK